MKDTEELTRSLATLTPSQQTAFKLMSDTNNQHLFVTGPGGTGKSYLIHTTVGHLTLKLGKFVHVLATSGSAAYLLGGQTVHRFFCLGPDLKTYLQFGTVDCCMVANLMSSSLMSVV